MFILAQIHPTCNKGARSPHLWSSDVGTVETMSLVRGKKNKTQTGILGGLNRSLACCDGQSECIM